MWFGVITLFPEMFACLEHGITGRALREKRVQLDFWNPRDFAVDRHRTVDDRPYGGGPGMVMLYQPLRDAILAAKQEKPDAKVIMMSPQGKPLKQQRLPSFVAKENLILLAGRYEGIDERILTEYVDEECSIGDYVLSGGELPATVLIDTITRLLPGALGNKDSAEQDSFVDGLLDYPHYTRPEEIDGLQVPPVLLSGDHQAIKQWREQQALANTRAKRPDLLTK